MGALGMKLNGAAARRSRRARWSRCARILLACVTAWALAALAPIGSAQAIKRVDLPPFEGGGPPWPAAISESGQVVGFAGTNHGDDAYSWTESGGAVDLASGPVYWSHANAVNGSGEVVGASDNAGAFSWTASGGLVLLDPLFPTSGFSEGDATAVNESGEVTGFGATEVGGVLEIHGFVWTRTGGSLDIGTLGGRITFPEFINSAGEVTGWAETASGDHHAFLWRRGSGIIDLGTLGGGTSYAAGINDAGEVVGETYASEYASEDEPRAFLWSPTRGMIDLGTLGGPYAKANAINNAGEVVGVAATTTVIPTWHGTGYVGHAFLWRRHRGMIDLGALPGGQESYANAISQSGQVVGISAIAEARHAFWWTPTGGMVDLGPGEEVVGINSSGQAVGHGVLWDTNPPGIVAPRAAPSGPTAAVLRADVEPKDQNTSVHADYAPANAEWCRSYGSRGSPTESSSHSIGSSHGIVSGVEVALEGLTLGTLYCAELVASNEAGTTNSRPIFFATPRQPETPARSRHRQQ